MGTTTVPPLEGHHPVSERERAEFGRAGHLCIRGLASAEEVEAYRPHIEQATRANNLEHRPLDERDTYGKAFLQTTNLWQVDDRVKAFVFSPRFARAAAELLGVDGVRLYHDQSLFKEAGGGPTPWHQDQFYWPFDDAPTITMWMLLAPVPREVGSMVFASGTHRLGSLLDRPISDESEAEFTRLIEERRLATETHGWLQPGDATFHHGWTLHSAGPNPTGVERSAMTVIYVADGARVAEPRHPYQEFDRRVWLDATPPGELVESPLNPRLWPPA